VRERDSMRGDPRSPFVIGVSSESLTRLPFSSTSLCLPSRQYNTLFSRGIILPSRFLLY